MRVDDGMKESQEILFKNDFVKKIGAEIITTGNELKKQEIVDFSRKLDIDALYEYVLAVKADTDAWLEGLFYDDCKKTFTQGDKNRIIALGVVFDDENAKWLIDYWCSKDIFGLIKMPLSRHWIMHIEAANRIKAKITK